MNISRSHYICLFEKSDFLSRAWATFGQMKHISLFNFWRHSVLKAEAQFIMHNACFSLIYTDGGFLLVWYDKIGIVHYTYRGVIIHYFPERCYYFSEDRFWLGKQSRSWWNAASCCISSGSSLLPTMLHNILVFTVCLDTCLGVFNIQSVT